MDDAPPATPAPPLPSCLPEPRWLNAEIQPVDWGMMLSQFTDFLAACRGTACWTQAKHALGVPSLYVVVDGLVKPWTRNTGCSVALRMNPAGALRAELMVSHSWGESMDECAEALQKFYKRKCLAAAVVLWFCAFAQYQPGSEPGDCGPTVNAQLAMDPFGSVIREVCSGLGMVVVQTSTADVYSRLWCVYEIAEAVVSKAPVAMAFSEASLESASGAFEALLRARTAKAKCRDPEDEQLIREKVKMSGGFKQLDSVIFSFRLQAFQEMMAELRESVRDELLREIDRFRQMATMVTQSSLGSGLLEERDRVQVGAVELFQQKSAWPKMARLFLLAPCVLVAAVLALPFLILCAPCLVCLWWRRKAQKNFCMDEDTHPPIPWGAAPAPRSEADPELPRPSAGTLPAGPPPAPKVPGRGLCSALGGDVYGSGDGSDVESEVDDGMLQARLLQVFKQAPRIFGKSESELPKSGSEKFPLSVGQNGKET